MSVTEPGSDLMPEVIALLLDGLVYALSQRGLAAERRGCRLVSAQIGVADRLNGDPAAKVRSDGRQTVICLPDRSGRLSWFWVRPTATSKTSPELEYLGPAGYIAATADRIARHLHPGERDMELAR